MERVNTDKGIFAAAKHSTSTSCTYEMNVPSRLDHTVGVYIF